MIPKIIHQACRDPAALRPEIRSAIEALQGLNPRWRHRLYGLDDVWRYLERRLDPRALNIARRVSPIYGRVIADLFRYVAAYHEGGVFLDVKSLALRPLDEVLRPDDRHLLSQPRSRLGERDPGGGSWPELRLVPGGEFEQWVIVTEGGHAFAQAAIQATLRNIERYSMARVGAGRSGARRVSGSICYTLAVWPILHQHPCRIVDAWELGFRRTLYQPYDALTYPDREDSAASGEPLVLPAAAACDAPA